MRSFLVILCVAIFSASIFILSDQPIHAEGPITVSSIGLDSTSIIEFKNSIDNNFNIDSVKIWLSKDNSFKSFKTEKGWTGKFEVGGQMLVFSSQDSIKPGNSAKFGVKTNSENPIINWKALDVDSNTLQSAAIITRESDNMMDGMMEQDVVQPKQIAINDNSSFRFIPEKPSIGSDFRIIGQNFIPNQSVDFYIDNQMIKSININADGNFISTATIPNNISEKRTMFVLIDSGGSEKTNSIRLYDNQNRDMSQDVKLSVSHTVKTVKRGDITTIDGNATPDSTLTLTTKNAQGKTLNIHTVNSGFDGKWNFENLFSVDLKLGKVSIEITDGKTTIVRDFEVISSQLINISPIQNRYEAGETIKFSGTAIPNQLITLIVEDPLGIEIFSKTMTVGGTGEIIFDVDTSMSSTEGTYVLHSFQGSESVIAVVGLGEQPHQILLVSTSKLNYNVGTTVDLMIHGEPRSSVSIVVVDESAKTKISDTIQIDENGNYVYSIETSDIGTGAFTVELRHGNSRGTGMFTVGLATGSGPIEFQPTKNEYLQGEQLVVIGNTGNSSLLNVEIIDPNGIMFRVYETFSDNVGTFKVDEFRIPDEASFGKWTIKISSGENYKERQFIVAQEAAGILVTNPNSTITHSAGDILEITGKHARVGASVFISILNSGGTSIDELILVSNSSGEFYTIWMIPKDLESGTYEIIAADTVSTNSSSLIIN
jgi:hypothetical protein